MMFTSNRIQALTVMLILGCYATQDVYIGDRVTVQWYADNRHYTGTVTGQTSEGQYMVMLIVQFDGQDKPRDYFGRPVNEHYFDPRKVRVIDDLQSLERKKNEARQHLDTIETQVLDLQRQLHDLKTEPKTKRTE